jgi:hypothetical protein
MMEDGGGRWSRTEIEVLTIPVNPIYSPILNLA